MSFLNGSHVLHCVSLYLTFGEYGSLYSQRSQTYFECTIFVRGKEFRWFSVCAIYLESIGWFVNRSTREQFVWSRRNIEFDVSTTTSAVDWYAVKCLFLLAKLCVLIRLNYKVIDAQRFMWERKRKRNPNTYLPMNSWLDEKYEVLFFDGKKNIKKSYCQIKKDDTIYGMN